MARRFGGNRRCARRQSANCRLNRTSISTIDTAWTWRAASSGCGPGALLHHAPGRDPRCRDDRGAQPARAPAQPGRSTDVAPHGGSGTACLSTVVSGGHAVASIAPPRRTPRARAVPGGPRRARRRGGRPLTEQLPGVTLATIAGECPASGSPVRRAPGPHRAPAHPLCRTAWVAHARAVRRRRAATNLLPGPASTQLAIFCAWPAGATGRSSGACAYRPGLVCILALSASSSRVPPGVVRGPQPGRAAVPAVALAAGLSLEWQMLTRARAGRWTAYCSPVWWPRHRRPIWSVLLACGRRGARPEPWAERGRSP